MHALLAHAYHLLLLPAHLAARPAWRSLAVCAAAAIAGRFINGRGAALAAVPVILAWLVLAPVQQWPPVPVARLVGLGAIVFGTALLGQRRGQSWQTLCASAALSAWWLRGMPADPAGIAGCVPAAFGFAGGFAAADRWAGREIPGVVAGALVLVAGLWLTGAAPHWAQAALAPACAAAFLAGIPGAAPMLARLTVCVAGAALVASDRGRVATIDLACLAPLPVWAAASFRARRAAAR